jgi:hypothetical protein
LGETCRYRGDHRTIRPVANLQRSHRGEFRAGFRRSSHCPAGKGPTVEMVLRAGIGCHHPDACSAETVSGELMAWRVMGELMVWRVMDVTSTGANTKVDSWTTDGNGSSTGYG